VANNVLTYGTGALNIDGSRVGEADGFGGGAKGTSGFVTGYESDGFVASTQGRWPANIIHDGSDEVLAGFPDAKGGTWNTTAGARHFNNDGEPTLYKTNKSDNSEGSAARFFYCAKASKSERNAGLEGLPNIHPTVKPLALMRYLIKLVTPPGGIVLDPFLGSGTTAMAAVMEGLDWIGCEMTEDYWPIIEARVEWAKNQQQPML
jgi:site-specific DNA-methyltransferase (adenine-specific)